MTDRARLCESRSPALPVAGALLLVLTALASPALLAMTGRAGWLLLAGPLAVASALLASRSREWLEPAAARHVRETTLFGWCRRREQPLSAFRGIGIARVQQRRSWRVLLVSPRSPLGHWGTHCGHVCIDVLGDRDAAERRARQLAEALPLDYVDA